MKNLSLWPFLAFRTIVESIRSEEINWRLGNKSNPRNDAG